MADEKGRLNPRALVGAMALRLAGVLGFFGLALFLPAGTLNFRPGWVYLGVLAVPLGGVLGWLWRHDPGLLERRLRHREPEEIQKTIVVITTAGLVATYVLAGLDYRRSWSAVPGWAMATANLLVLAGYGFVFLVFRENSYTSRVVEVERGQRVVSTGPYALVRHPMYAGMTVMYLATPVALGSWWSLLPALTIPAALVVRLRHEEQVLAKGLRGYAAYCRKTPYRLVPGVW